MSNDFVFNERKYKKIHIIQNTDDNAGFSALITYTLNGIRKALENDWLPVVNFDKNNTPLFYDPAHGENVWEYFFDPIGGASYSQVQAWLAEGLISDAMLHSYSAAEIFGMHLEDSDRVAPFWAWDKPKSPAQWMAEKRKLGRRYVNSYVKVKPPILEKASSFQKKYYINKYIIGVHIRGTDFAYAEPTSVSDYFSAIHSHLKSSQINDFKLFLATDQAQYVELFQQEYKDKLMHYNVARSDDHIPPFHLDNISGYKKGEDVLLDILLLSRCNFLFKGAAAVGEYALWFNPNLESHDFALTSDFVHIRYSLRKSAFLKMDIGNQGFIRVKFLTAVQLLKQLVTEAKVIIKKYFPL